MNGKTFTTTDVAQLFGVSVQAAKNWARQFSEYLSPSATPQSGLKRNFVEDDLRVFALVRDYTVKGRTFADAGLALRAGQRGDIPTSALTAPAPHILVALREEIERLKVGGDEAKGQVKLLKEQLAEKEQRIETLIAENALLKAGQKK